MDQFPIRLALMNFRRIFTISMYCNHSFALWSLVNDYVSVWRTLLILSRIGSLCYIVSWRSAFCTASSRICACTDLDTAFPVRMWSTAFGAYMSSSSHEVTYAAKEAHFHVKGTQPQHNTSHEASIWLREDDRQCFHHSGWSKVMMVGISCCFPCCAM